MWNNSFWFRFIFKLSSLNCYSLNHNKFNNIKNIKFPIQIRMMYQNQVSLKVMNNHLNSNKILTNGSNTTTNLRKLKTYEHIINSPILKWRKIGEKLSKNRRKQVHIRFNFSLKELFFQFFCMSSIKSGCAIYSKEIYIVSELIMMG